VNDTIAIGAGVCFWLKIGQTIVGFSTLVGCVSGCGLFGFSSKSLMLYTGLGKEGLNFEDHHGMEFFKPEMLLCFKFVHVYK